MHLTNFAAGLSHADALAIFEPARTSLDETLDLDGLDDLEDEDAIRALTAARGPGDLGTRNAVHASWRGPASPSIEQVQRLGEQWSPNRTCAAALLWTSLQEERSD